MRNLLRCSLLLISIAALVAGCSDSSTDAPGNAPHPDSWYEQHRATATTTAFVDECGGCHVVKNEPGPAVPPSCFSVSFDGRTCHAKGPGNPPHPMDGSFLAGKVHGKVAKADLTFYQKCHSNDPYGGPGSNPRFNVGIFNPAGPAPGTGCEQCHGKNLAHPVPWAGPNDNQVYHYSAKSIQKACTLCHGVALDGVGGVGINCKACHAGKPITSPLTAASAINSRRRQHPEPRVAAEGGILVNHAAVLLANHDQCATCHGVKSSGAGSAGFLDPSPNYQAFNKITDTLGDHWNGQINMNINTGYNADNFGCYLACHADDADHRLSDSQLPVTLGAYGHGEAPHPVGDIWLEKSSHALIAVDGSPNCLSCHTLDDGQVPPSCLGCHQVAPIMDPATALTNAGCASCHSYPPDGVTPVKTDPNRAGQHGEHFNLTADTGNCSACHDGAGSDTTNHYIRIDQTTPRYPAVVNLLVTYNAKSGPAMYDPQTQTCSSVSCHGGLTTPNWYTGTLPSTDPSAGNEYCLSCHTYGTSEYNGFYSGEHDLHVNQSKVPCVSATILRYLITDSTMSVRPIGVILKHLH